MKERILKGWHFRRAVYLALGLAVIVFAIQQHDWMVGLIGGYFSAMAIFSFGCASGNCFAGGCSVSKHPSKIPEQTMSPD